MRWPGQSDRREYCRELRIPRLLVIEGNAAPPICADELEDWVRLPVSPDDFQARTRALQHRANLSVLPQIDEDDVLRYGGRWLALSPVESRLMQALIDAYQNVVSRDVLVSRGWPRRGDGRPPRRNALDLQILRLRRRLEPLRLVIQTVWGRGYLLEPSAVAPGRLASAADRGHSSGPAEYRPGRSSHVARHPDGV